MEVSDRDHLDQYVRYRPGVRQDCQHHLRVFNVLEPPVVRVVEPFDMLSRVEGFRRGTTWPVLSGILLIRPILEGTR